MRAALLLGISEYKNPANNLPGCERDLALMDNLLHATEEYEHILTLSGTNVKAMELKNRVSEWVDEQRKNRLEELFFYYSGHGEFFQNEFYFQLYDFQDTRRNQTSLTNSDLDTWLRSLSPELTVKVIDACNSGIPYIKSGQDTVRKFFTDAMGGFKKCIFMYSSTIAQSSYQSNEHSDFTNAFFESIRQHEGEIVRYREITEFISDEFENSGNSDLQSPIFITQAHNTEVFCSLNEHIRQLSFQEQDKKQAETLSEPKAGVLKQIAEEAAKEIPSKEQALEILGGLRGKLEAFEYTSDLAEIYNLKSKIIATSQVPLRSRIGQSLASNRHNYFAEPTYTTVYDNPMDAIMAQQTSVSGLRGVVSRGRKEVDGFQFTAEVPFEAFQVTAQRKYLSLSHFYCVITYLVSKSKLMFYYYYTTYREKNWDETFLDLDVVWRNVECSFTNPETIWSTGSDILSGFQNYILDQVKVTFNQK